MVLAAGGSIAGDADNLALLRDRCVTVAAGILARLGTGSWRDPAETDPAPHE